MSHKTIQDSLKLFVASTKSFNEFKELLTQYVREHKCRFVYSDKRILITNDNKSSTGDSVTSAANGIIFEYPSCKLLCLPIQYIFKITPSYIHNYKSYQYSPIEQGSLLHCYKFNDTWKIASHGGYEVNDMFWNNTLTFQQAFEHAAGVTLNEYCESATAAVPGAHTLSCILQHPLLHAVIHKPCVKLCAALGDDVFVDYRVKRNVKDMKKLVSPVALAARETYGIILHGPTSFVVENNNGKFTRKLFNYYPTKISHQHRNIYVALRAIRSGITDDEFKKLVQHVPGYFSNYLKTKYVVAYIALQIIYYNRKLEECEPEPFIKEMITYFGSTDINMNDVRNAALTINDMLYNTQEHEAGLIKFIYEYTEVPK